MNIIAVGRRQCIQPHHLRRSFKIHVILVKFSRKANSLRGYGLQSLRPTRSRP